MKIDTIKKILQTNNISEQLLNEFITDYIKSEKNKDISLEELMAIRQLIQMGVFDIRYAATQAAIKLNYNVLNIYHSLLYL